MKKFDLVLHGPIYPFTKQVVEHYAKFPFIENIIVSAWEKDIEWSFTKLHEKATCIFNKDVWPGIVNVNRQITSSFEGVKRCTSDYVINTRTDCIWWDHTMYMMYDFFNKFEEPELCYLDGEKPKSRLFCSTHYMVWKYGIFDVIIWGHKDDMVKFYDIPHYKEEYTGGPWGDYTKYMRAECYIGLNYYAKFDSTAKMILENIPMYAVDNAPYSDIAAKNYYDLSSKVIMPFPLKGQEFSNLKWKTDTYHWNEILDKYQGMFFENDPHHKGLNYESNF